MLSINITTSQSIECIGRDGRACYKKKYLWCNKYSLYWCYWVWTHESNSPGNMRGHMVHKCNNPFQIPGQFHQKITWLWITNDKDIIYWAFGVKLHAYATRRHCLKYALNQYLHLANHWHPVKKKIERKAQIPNHHIFVQPTASFTQFSILHTALALFQQLSC